MTVGNLNGLVQDIFVNKIPSTVSVGGSIRIGVGSSTEILKVLNIYDTNKILRVSEIQVLHILLVQMLIY